MPLNKLRFFCKTKIPFLLGSNGLYFRVTIWWWVSVGFAYLSPAISQVAGLYGSVREVGYKYNFVRRLSVLLFLLLHFFHTRFFRWQKKGDKGQVAQVSRFFQLPRCFFVCFWCFGVGQESWKHDLGSFLGLGAKKHDLTLIESITGTPKEKLSVDRFCYIQVLPVHKYAFG